MVFRLDYFPMTWAPMYSAVIASDDYVVSSMDKDKLKENGFLVKHQDGTRSKVNYKDLNIPFRSFWRIYSQRPYHIGPQVHRFAINEDGPYDVIKKDWEKLVFDIINKTLAYDTTHPKYVVEVTVAKSFLFFTDSKSDMRLEKTIEDTLTIYLGKPHADLLVSRPFLKKLVE